ncbi:MAG TPA: winged helix DNA-binding protein [Sphingomicrobium sp.]|nr:winged helix DNA-binding protein [Sphingomicrobium sp.]
MAIADPSKLLHQESLASAAGEIYRMRRARDRLMPKGFRGEPAWDMLLALFSEAPSKLTVSSLCFCSGVPSSTSLRWIDVLARAGLLERTSHPRDDEIVFVSLTDDGRFLIERCLEAMLGSPID